MDIPLIWSFHAGYEAGARAVDPSIEIMSAYLSEWPDVTGFDNGALAFQEATRMYGEGADVVFPAAGASGFGVMQAALQWSESGDHVWTIGVDVDQCVGGGDPYDPYILTSIVKEYDDVVFRLLSEYANGSIDTGPRLFDLADGGVGITYSGGFIDDLESRLDVLEGDIVAARIEVPCVPDERVDEATDLGIAPGNACGSP